LIDPSDDGFELDPSLINISGKLYLLGSYTKPGLQSLFIRPMANPFTPSGKKVLLSQPLLPWEKSGFGVNEGPEPLQHNGKTFIVYSASFCGTPDYKLGLLEFTGGDPLNRAVWHKRDQPVFQRSDRNHVFGPGHNGFFKSPDGKEDWIVYHANDSPAGKCDGGRTSRAQKFSWNADGTPNFGEPVANGVRLQSPSGE
jgi:GH43 family beta-xylosidase